MTAILVVLSTLLVACIFGMHHYRKALIAERAHSRSTAELAYMAVTELRDIVHALSSTPQLHSSSPQCQAFMKASDLICNALHNSTTNGVNFENESLKLSSDVAGGCENAKRLADLDLGDLNSRRDALLENPKLDTTLALVESLMDRVMRDLNQANEKQHRSSSGRSTPEFESFAQDVNVSESYSMRYDERFNAASGMLIQWSKSGWQLRKRSREFMDKDDLTPSLV